ncbi:MAG: hypothetical protein IJ615_10515 [Bacteroidaceae bacterium]|nr:hypothetical protein [Bacteroidaceae bacterium]
MPSQNAPVRPTRKKKETSLREAIMWHVGQFFELHGLEAAIDHFEGVKAMFSGVPDWAGIEVDVTGFFLEKRREALQKEHERQQQLDSAMMEGYAKGMSIGQQNMLTGANSQAPYYPATPMIGGFGNDKRRTK